MQLWPSKIYFMVILRAQTDIIYKTSGISFDYFITYSFEHAILKKYVVNLLMLDLTNLVLLNRITVLHNPDFNRSQKYQVTKLITKMMRSR